MAQVIDAVATVVVTKVIPALMKSLVDLIIGGFKAGPMGALMSGAAVVGIGKALIKSKRRNDNGIRQVYACKGLQCCC